MAKAFEFCNLHPKCRRRVGHTGLCVTFDGEFDMQKKISTDPDEPRLREMIAEKDRHIAALEATLGRMVHDLQPIVKDTDRAGLRLSQIAINRIAEKDAEIERLKTELSTNWAKHESAIKKPLSIKEAIESINSGPGWVTAVTISRTEWKRLLTAIQQIEKDAERYKKLRAHGNQGQNATFLGWSVDMSYADNSIEFDAAVDALPEVQS